jgi:hypothetical protein
MPSESGLCPPCRTQARYHAEQEQPRTEIAIHTGPSGTARIDLRPDAIAGDFYAVTLELDFGVISRSAATIERAREIFADLAALANQPDEAKPRRRKGNLPRRG